ncbi:MAG TPA: VOC family protein [Lacunisphaera sp.]|jgi:hypothetical protein
MRLFDHLDLRVTSLMEVEPFYRVVLPALGFPVRVSVETWVCYEASRDHSKPEFVALIEDRNHTPNATRIAFWCESKEEVDRFARVLPGCGAKKIEGPELCPEYTPNYYAVFFEDPCGNRFEACCRTYGLKNA